MRRTEIVKIKHGYTLRRRADRGGCSSPRGMEWRASEPPSALMAKAQPASFLAGYALEMWWSGSWLGRGSNITELLVRTLDNTQSVIGKVPNVNMLNLPNLCPISRDSGGTAKCPSDATRNSGGTSDDENTEDASWTAGNSERREWSQPATTL